MVNMASSIDRRRVRLTTTTLRNMAATRQLIPSPAVLVYSVYHWCEKWTDQYDTSVGQRNNLSTGQGSNQWLLTCNKLSWYELSLLLRPFPSSLVPLFQTEFKCETFHIKMSSECSFIFMQIKVICNRRRFAPGLALKKRHKGTRKWPICSIRDEVVRKPDNANPGLKVNWRIHFF